MYVVPQGFEQSSPEKKVRLLRIDVYHIIILLIIPGFDVNLLIASGLGKNRQNHVMLIVIDVENNGDRFLVDVGLGYPTFRAVSLNFTVGIYLVFVDKYWV